MAVFVGEFDQTIDVKHRLAIPAALRDQIDPETDGKSFFLVLGPDKHLWLYPDLAYRQMLGGLQRSPLPSRKSRRMDLLFALARLIKPDGQGRVVLPEKSMQRAVLAKEVTLVGKGDHIELWPTEEWEQYVADNIGRYGQDILDAGDGFEAETEADN
jgi:MraZ protein